MDYSKFNFITQNFFFNSKIIKINIVEAGLINNTYIIEHLYNGKKSKFVLQSLSNIFESHEIVNINHKLITDHIKNRIDNNSFDFHCKKWKVPSLIKCKSNNLFSFPFELDVWRALVYIDESFVLNILEDVTMAYKVGVGLSKFHLFCSDFKHSNLKTSLKYFHNTSYYLDQYIYTLNNYNFEKLDDELKKRIQDLINSLSRHIPYVDFLFKSLMKESIDPNIIHGDPKLSNFLFDMKCKDVISLIDLDTVSLGYLLTDLADCIRSICNLVGDDPNNKEDVFFDIKSCKFFLKGYFSISKEHQNASFRFLPEFIYLIIFELTIRFLTDFLQSNSYFNIEYATHNLYRAEVQFRLLSSFVDQIPTLLKSLYNFGITSSSTFVNDIQKIV